MAGSLSRWSGGVGWHSEWLAGAGCTGGRLDVRWSMVKRPVGRRAVGRMSEIVVE